MRRMINSLEQDAKSVGLKINVTKTKIMIVCNTREEWGIYIGHEKIKRVQSFRYLGSIVNEKGGSEEDIQNRVKKARQVFRMLNNTWTSTQISRKTKIRIFNSNINPVLLYGCESWVVTKKSAKTMQTVVNKCLRRIMKIFWSARISNRDLWNETKQILKDLNPALFPRCSCFLHSFKSSVSVPALSLHGSKSPLPVSVSSTSMYGM